MLLDLGLCNYKLFELCVSDRSRDAELALHLISNNMAFALIYTPGFVQVLGRLFDAESLETGVTFNEGANGVAETRDAQLPLLN